MRKRVGMRKRIHLGARRPLSKQEFRELFWWAREKSSTEDAIDFIVALAKQNRDGKGWVNEVRATVKAMATIRRAARAKRIKPRQPDALRDREIRRVAAPVLEAVAARAEMSVRAMLQRFSTVAHANARHEASWLLRQQGMSYPEIATATERDDHTTAMHAVARVEARIAERPGLRGELLGLVAGATGMRATG